MPDIEIDAYLQELHSDVAELSRLLNKLKLVPMDEGVISTPEGGAVFAYENGAWALNS